jgi:glycosyltransferase involved in cell wall biosynthesis
MGTNLSKSTRTETKSCPDAGEIGESAAAQLTILEDSVTREAQTTTNGQTVMQSFRRSTERPLRIAVIAACPFPVPRGTPIRILRLSEALAEAGHDVHVLTYHLGSGPVDPRLKVHRIEDIPSYRKLSPGPTVRKLVTVDRKLTRLAWRILRTHDFDVIHAHHYEGLLVARAARGRLKVPIVYDAHTLLASELPFYPLGLPEGMKHALGRWMDRIFPRLADHTVCVTDTIRDKFRATSHLDEKCVSVIRNGVELEHFRSVPRKSEPGDHGPSVIFTGNLAEYQGIDNLLEAFRLAVEQVPDARLVIGTDSPTQPLEEYAGRLGIREQIDIVASPGFAELPELLAQADVAINPRVDCDGVPVKLLNYMAAGLPVVSFDSSAPGVTHLENGWLAASGDRAALATGIVQLLKDPDLARRIGAAAQQYIEDNCRWQLAAERCESLYAQLLDSSDQLAETPAG